jgi:hypothetical protein
LAYLELHFKNLDLLLHAFPAVNSNTDTLIKSNMPKDPDSTKCVDAQVPELKSWQKMQVFNVQHIQASPLDSLPY